MSIQPKFNEEVMVTCASCGTTFMTGSTSDKIVMEVCSNCHPFYTREQRFMDSKGRIEKYERKQQQAKEMQKKLQERKSKKMETTQRSTKSLKELLAES